MTNENDGTYVVERVADPRRDGSLRITELKEENDKTATCKPINNDEKSHDTITDTTQSFKAEKTSRIGNQNARFWTRPDIERALASLDTWASVKLHSMRMAYEKRTTVAAPQQIVDQRGRAVGETIAPVYQSKSTGTQLVVGGDYRGLTSDAITGVLRIGEARAVTSVAAMNERGLHPSRVTAIIVDQVIADHETDLGRGVLIRLLLHLHPREGVYERRGSIETFRPKVWVAQQLEEYTGKRPGRHLDGILRRSYRSLVVTLAANQKDDYG